MPYEAGSVYALLDTRFDEGGFDRFDRRVAKARGEAARPVTQQLKADYDGRRFQQFERDLKRIEGRRTQLKIDADLSGLRRDLHEAETLARSWEQTAQRNEGFRRRSAQAEADAARRRASGLRQEISMMESRSRTQRRHLQDMQLEEQRARALSRIDRERDRLAAGAAGGGGINRIRSALRGGGDDFEGFNRGIRAMKNAWALIQWPAIVAGIGLAMQALNALAAAAVGLAGSLGQLAAAAVAVPAALGAIFQGVGVLALAGTGLVGVLKEMSNQQAAGGATARDTGREHRRAAEQVQDAHRAVGQAVKEETNARRDLHDAYHQARRDLEDMRLAVAASAMDVSDATQRWQQYAFSVGDGGRQVTDSIRGMRDAMRDETQTERDLADAREEAKRQIEDLRSAFEHTALSVGQAQARLNEALATGKGVAEAQLNLADAQREHNRSIEDLNKALGQNERVAASQRAMIQAQRDEADAIKGVTDAQRDEREEAAQRSRDEQRAQLELRRAITDHRRAVEDLAKAQRGGLRNMDAVRSAADRLESAQRNVADAQRQLARAQRDARQNMGAAGTAADALAKKMAKLPPAAQQFARFLFSLKPRLDQLRQTAASGLFPGVETGIRRALSNFPALNRVVGLTARSMGGLAAQTGAFVGSKAFGRDFETIGKTNVALIGNMGRGSINLASALRHVLVAADPFLRWLGTAVEHMTRWIDAQAHAGRASGRLAGFFDHVRSTLEIVGRILGHVGLALLRIGVIADRELGQHILRKLDLASASLERWTRTGRGQQQITKYFRDAVPVVDELGRLVRDLTIGLLKMGSGTQTAGLVRQLRTQLLPVLLDLFTSAAKNLGPVLIEGFTALARILHNLAPALGTASRVFSGLLRVVAWLLDHGGPLKAIIASMLALRGLYVALRLAATISGLQTVVKLLRQVGVLSAAEGAAGAGGGLLGGLFGRGGKPAGGGQVLTKGDPLAGAEGGLFGSLLGRFGKFGKFLKFGATRIALPVGIALSVDQFLLGGRAFGDFFGQGQDLSGYFDKQFKAIQQMAQTAIDRHDLAGLDAAIDRAHRLAREFPQARAQYDALADDLLRRKRDFQNIEFGALERLLQPNGPVRNVQALARALALVPARKRFQIIMEDKDTRQRLANTTSLLVRFFGPGATGRRYAAQIITNAKSASDAIAGMRAVLKGVPVKTVMRILHNAPDSRTAVQRLDKAVRGLPPSRKIAFSTPGLNLALRNIEKLRTWLDDLRKGGVVVPFTTRGQLSPTPPRGGRYGGTRYGPDEVPLLQRQRGGTMKLTPEDLQKSMKGPRGGKAGPGAGAGKAGAQIVVYGEGDKQEWWISQEGDRRRNIAWAIEALEKLTGRKVQLAVAGFASKRRTIPLTDPLTGRHVQVPASERAGLYRPSGQFGGKTLTSRIHGMLSRMEPLRSTISTKTRQYEQLGRDYGLSNEILLKEDPATGDLVVDQNEVDKQAKEFDDLAGKAAEIRDLYYRLQSMYSTAVGQIQAAITFFQNQVNDQLKKLRKTAPRDRPWRLGLLKQFRSNVKAMQDLLPEAQQGQTDAGLDANDWDLTRREQESLAADVRATTGEKAPKGDAGDAGSGQPTPEDIAKAAFAEYSTFQAARASLARDFGANFMRTGGKMDQGEAEYGYRYYGALGGNEEGSGGGQTRQTTINVTNNYGSGPGDPHTWSQDMKWQVSALGV